MCWCTAEHWRFPQASLPLTLRCWPAQVLGQLMTRALAARYHAGLKAYQTALAFRPQEQALLPLVAWTTGCEGVAPDLLGIAEQNVLKAIIRCLPCLDKGAGEFKSVRLPSQCHTISMRMT